uniref:DOMON domain-containing protein n=1 Tax=Parascaris univalens TaxID=6257 RepID=A0A915BM52_PARUN
MLYYPLVHSAAIWLLGAASVAEQIKPYDILAFAKHMTGISIHRYSVFVIANARALEGCKFSSASGFSANWTAEKGILKVDIRLANGPFYDFWVGVGFANTSVVLCRTDDVREQRAKADEGVRVVQFTYNVQPFDGEITNHYFRTKRDDDIRSVIRCDDAAQFTAEQC